MRTHVPKPIGARRPLNRFEITAGGYDDNDDERKNDDIDENMTPPHRRAIVRGPRLSRFGLPWTMTIMIMMMTIMTRISRILTRVSTRSTILLAW